MRIQEAIQLSNLEAVRRMGLKPGDIVFKPDDPVERDLKESDGGEMGVHRREKIPREFEVSSIREDGQVYFKGGTEQAPARYLEKRTTSEGGRAAGRDGQIQPEVR